MKNMETNFQSKLSGLQREPVLSPGRKMWSKCEQQSVEVSGSNFASTMDSFPLVQGFKSV